MNRLLVMTVVLALASTVSACGEDVFGRPDYNRKADRVKPLNTGESFGRDGIEIRITGRGYSEGYPFLEISTFNNSSNAIKQAHFYARAMQGMTVIDTGMVNVSSTGTLYPGETSRDKAYFYDIHRHKDYQYLDIRGFEWVTGKY